MKIALVQLKQTEKPLTEEEMANIRKAIIHGRGFNDSGEIHWWEEVLVDVDALPLIKYEVSKWVWLPPPNNAIGLDTDTASRNLAYNHKVNVVVPGFGMLAITEVKVCTDYCTEALNDELKAGWRILAICPQPDQRRPDYVIGRASKDES